MTETTTFPFASLQDDASADEGDRRPFAVVLGGGLLAVALVGGAVFAFGGGDEELPVGSPVSTGAGTSAVAPPAETELAQTLPVANTESTARSPFEPKYVEPAPVVEAPAEAPIADPASIPTVVVRDPQGVLVPVGPGTYVPTSPGSAPAAPAPAPAPAAAPREYRLVLTGVTVEGDVPTAQFTIDGAVSSVKATDIFGPHRQLLLRSLQQGPKDGQWTATIQVGDARPIDVVTGEAVFVQ